MKSGRSAVAFVCLALVGTSAGGAVAGALADWIGIAPLGPAALGALAGIAAAFAFRKRLASTLPDELDAWFTRRRRLRWLWLVVAAVAVLNTARISLFIADATQVWASAFPPVVESARHQCLAAYVRAGELAEQHHADLWQLSDYAREGTTTKLDGIEPYLGDPYEYPPTFAVIPRAAVAATDDYQLMRALWFALSASMFWLVFIALARWIGGRPGASSLLLAPVLALSFSLTLGLQWGQAHALVVAAALAGMLAFARGRTLAGGALLGFAIATKIFPGLLLVHLAIRRQWRAFGATLAMIAAFVVLALVVLGPSTFTAFVSDHVPRMASGEAFAYTEHNPDNYSLYSLWYKLADLGIGVGRGFGSALSMLWAAVALALTVVCSRRGVGDRPHEALGWLAILCLATLQSPFAPSYTAIGSLWLLTIANPRPRWLVVICWVLLQGAPPIGSQAMNTIASLPAQIATIAIALLASVRLHRAAQPVTSPSGTG